MLQSAEMAATTPTRINYKRSLSYGQFTWKDQLRGGKICSSTLEITEQSDVAHVLHFTMNYAKINEKPLFVVKVYYLEGVLEKDILINFDLTLKIFRNETFQHLGQFKATTTGKNPIWKKKETTWHFPYDQITYRLTDAEFSSNVQVSVDLQLHINNAKPKLTDKTEPSLAEAIGNLYFDNEFSDIKIICDGKEFPCHKLLLSLRSSVFKAMFSSDLKISDAEDESTLKIDDISAGTMTQFIKFLYTDELKSEDIDANLLIAANKYDLKRLVNICVKHLESIIDVENVMEITFTAYLIDNDQLLQKASKFISNNIGTIKKPEQWDQINKTYPHIAKKVIDLILFDNQPSPPKKNRESL